MIDQRRIRYNATSHVGRVREVNEDCILALPKDGIWVVADGMGGHAAGDFASQTLCDMVAALPSTENPSERMHGVRNAIMRSHDAITAEADRRGLQTIGTTVVSLILTDHHFVAFWVGDSRIYRLRGGLLEMLTMDHSLVAPLVAAGKLTWDEADLHPQANVITRAVGVGEELEIDKVRGEVAPGDRFLLCSDGLTKYTTDAMLARELSGPIENVADALLDIALTSGGADNISIIVVDVA